MIYLVGTIGFILGFFLGQLILLRLLKNIPNDELMEKKETLWKYGFLNWIVAVLTSASAVWLYKFHFLDGAM